MARVVKKAAERRSEILQKAQEFFFKVGYNKTSVNMIIEALKISKGAFYHYFRSKEDLLDSLSEEFTHNIKLKIEAVIADPNLNAIDKLNKMYSESGSYKVKKINLVMAMTEALYSDDNLLLRYKFHQKSLEDFVPLMTTIFQQGIEEGVFEIENAEIMARLVLLFGTSIAEYNAKLLLQLKVQPDKLDELYENFLLYQKSVERMLGAPNGSVQAFDRKFFNAFGKFLEESK